MGTYAQLKEQSHRLRIDAHILDYFRDNDGNFADAFRRVVREQAHLHKQPYEKAFDRVLTDLRDALAEKVDSLSPVRSNNMTHDHGQLRVALRFIGEDMAAKLYANPLTELPTHHYKNSVEQTLAALRRDSMSGSDLRIDGAKDSTAPTAQLNALAQELLQNNLMREYSSDVAAATKRLQTRLGDRLEAESLLVAINEINQMNIVEKYSPFSDGHRAETKEAVVNSLRARGVNYRPQDVDAIVEAAIPLADAGPMPDRGGKGPQR